MSRISDADAGAGGEPGGPAMGDATAVAEAVAVLRRGGLVAFPTETVYGLGADARNPAAVARVFAAKGRPAAHPLIVHLGDAARLEGWARDVPATARRLAERFWPGPLTLILRRAAGVLDIVTGGQDTVGLRIPAHPTALALLCAFGDGVAAPSANRFGRVSPTTAADTREELGEAVDLVLDGGPCAVGLESTIVDLSGDAPAVLRPGAVTAEALDAALGAPVPLRTGGPVRSPGQFPSHYAPRAAVEMASEAEVGARVAALVARGLRTGVMAVRAPADLPAAATWLPLPADLADMARVLYARLRAVDRLGLDAVVVVAPPEPGLGEAISDRLRRAAAPRAEAPASDDAGPTDVSGP
jgi:L-threonylcarbamoyladenylate synthase